MKTYGIAGVIIGTVVALSGLALSQQKDKAVMVELAEKPEEPKGVVKKSDEEWKKELTPEQYRILRQSGTERAFGEVYKQFKEQGAGTYYCAGCGAELFTSNEKFDSGCGWPSFFDPSQAKNVKLIPDVSHGMIRTEVRCAVCDGHLGHVFEGEGFDTPTDQRYCINGVALKFVPAGETIAEDKEAEVVESSQEKEQS